MNVGKDAHLGFTNRAARMIDEGRRDLHITVERSRVVQVAFTRIIRKHAMCRTVVFVHGGLAKRDLLDLHANLVFVIDGFHSDNRGSTYHNISSCGLLLLLLYKGIRGGGTQAGCGCKS